MAFNVDRFISHFDSHAGFARSSKFEVRVALPPALFRLSGGTMEELSLQCEAAELPGYNLNTVESKIFGAPTHIAASPSFGDISLTFICAGDMWEKKFFDAWLDFIIPKSTYLASYKTEYQTSITIHQYSDFSKENFSIPEPGLSERLSNTLNNPITKIADKLLNNSISKIGSKVGNIFSQLDKLKPESPRNLKPTEIFACKLIDAFPVSVNALPLSWSADDIHKLTVVFKYSRWLNTDQANGTNLPPTKNTPGTDGANQRNVRGLIVPQLNLGNQGKIDVAPPNIKIT